MNRIKFFLGVSPGGRPPFLFSCAPGAQHLGLRYEKGLQGER